MKLQLLALSISAISLASIIAAPILAIVTPPHASLINQPTLLAQRAGTGDNRSSAENPGGATPRTGYRIIVKIIEADGASGVDSASNNILAAGLPGTLTRMRGDYFVTVKVNGQSLQPTQKINSNHFPVFNATRQIVIPSMALVPIELSLVDDDLIGDTVVDISPSPTQRVLKLRYSPTTGKVFDNLNKEIGRSGQSITSNSDKRSSNGFPASSLTFSISHELVR